MLKIFLLSKCFNLNFSSFIICTTKIYNFMIMFKSVCEGGGEEGVHSEAYVSIDLKA